MGANRRQVTVLGKIKEQSKRKEFVVFDCRGGPLKYLLVRR